MAFRSPALELRQPNSSWMLGGVLLTLCLFGLLWFAFSQLVNLEQPDGESRLVMVSALGWMVCAIAWWKMRVPQSRLHAVLAVLLCTLVVALAGTLVHFIGLLFRGVLFDKRVLVTVSLVSGLMLIAQLIVAIPAAMLMQQIVLRRAAPEAPHLPG